MLDVTYETGDELGRFRRPDREGIPVGDNRDGSVYAVTVDEETGEKVVVVDTFELERLLWAFGGVDVKPRCQSDPFDPFFPFSSFDSGLRRAMDTLDQIINAIRERDTLVIFKGEGFHLNAEG